MPEGGVTQEVAKTRILRKELTGFLGDGSQVCEAVEAGRLVSGGPTVPIACRVSRPDGLSGQSQPAEAKRSRRTVPANRPGESVSLPRFERRFSKQERRTRFSPPPTSFLRGGGARDSPRETSREREADQFRSLGSL